MAKINPFKNAMSQLSAAAEILNLDKSVLEQLKKPQRILSVSIPVKMDNGETKVFEGFRVQYNDARGPFKGGIRYHPQVDMDEIKAFGFWQKFFPNQRRPYSPCQPQSRPGGSGNPGHPQPRTPLQC